MQSKNTETKEKNRLDRPSPSADFFTDAMMPHCNGKGDESFFIFVIR